MDVRAAALARVTAAAQGQPLLHVTHRHCCWECQRFLTVSAVPCALLQNVRGEGALPCLALVCALSLCVMACTLPCQRLRHEERMSFVLAVTPTALLWTEEDRIEHACCCRAGLPPAPPPAAARLADVLEARQATCCCCCWSVQVLLRDPATGGRKQTTCCCCLQCNAAPDHSWGCLAGGAEAVAAIRQHAQRAAAGARAAGAEPSYSYQQSAPLLAAPPPYLSYAASTGASK